MKPKAAYWWAVLVLAVALGVGGYWLYRVQPGPALTVTQPRDGTAQKSPAATREAPARKPVPKPAESLTERPAAVPSRVEPAQPSAAELAAQAQALMNQANAAMDRGEYDAAIAFYRRALELDPTNQQAGVGIDRAQSAKTAEEATN
jgi:tetratricopeptide (TPR) repeat protein